jgi:arylsulfatase A-like enzyme
MAKPNIVFITCHDLGRYLGCYGAPVSSPNLDRLASDGVLFKTAFAASPLCSPSRAALHTGLTPHQLGVNGLSHPPFGMEIQRPEAHFAHHLSGAGYRERILVGFQHLTADSDSLGYTDARFRLDSADSISAEACEVIQKMDTGSPFYLEVGFFETHRPFDWGNVGPAEQPERNPFPSIPDGKATRAEAAALGGAVKALDDGVGRILEALEKKGISDNTWVVFVTDHGLPFPRAKGTLYDPGLETALLMRWPDGGLCGGIAFPGLVSLIDVVPTMASALKLQVRETLEGVDLWPALSMPAGSSSPRRELFGEKTFHTGYEPLRCIRNARYKLIVNFETGPAFDIATDIVSTPTAPLVLQDLPPLRPTVELYDLQANPQEKNNLAEAADLAIERDRMLQILSDWMRRTSDPLLSGPVESPAFKRACSLVQGEGRRPPAGDIPNPSR